MSALLRQCFADVGASMTSEPIGLGVDSQDGLLSQDGHAEMSAPVAEEVEGGPVPGGGVLGAGRHLG